MTSPCAASSPRTGFGKWKKWTASPSEGACGAWPCLWAESGACPACDPVSHLSHCRLRLLLPDSLTTWEIHGVSLSKSTGAVTLPGPLASLFHAPWSEAPCLVLSSWYRKEGQRPGDVCMPSMGPEAREQRQAGDGWEVGGPGAGPAPHCWAPLGVMPPGLSYVPLIHQACVWPPRPTSECSMNSTCTSACQSLSAALSSLSCGLSSTTTWIAI